MSSINDLNNFIAKFLDRNVQALGFLDLNTMRTQRSSNDITIVQITRKRFDIRDFIQSQGTFNQFKRNLSVVENGRMKVRDNTIKEIMNKASQNQNTPIRAQNVQVQVVDENGKVQEKAELVKFTEAEEKIMDQALDQYRTVEMAKLANNQVKTPDHDKTDVSSSAESTSAQAVAPKKKSKNATSIDMMGASRETKKRDRYAEQVEARERAQEKREAAQEYTEARDNNQERIDRDTEDHNMKQQNLKKDNKS